MKRLVVDPTKRLTVNDVVSYAKDPSSQIALSAEAKKRVMGARAVIEKALKEKPPKKLYGITTGFGAFQNVYLENPKERRELQENLLRSHAVGVGKPFPPEIVRAALLIRIYGLCLGYSGVRVSLAEKLCEMFNSGLVPHVPQIGSLGASGDLAQLSHLFLPLLGVGVFLKPDGKPRKMTPAERKRFAYGLAEKEGLALNNGTAFMVACLCFALDFATRLCELADVISAMSLEAIEGTCSHLDPRLYLVRNHPGAAESAHRIREALKASPILDKHHVRSVPRVQEAYSFRCAPTVHGASLEQIRFASEVLLRELNAATDNPLIFPDTGEVVSGGNFHGEPLAQAADGVKRAMAALASISERRTAALLDPNWNYGLPAFLVHPKAKPGLHSGLMIVQYTQAALLAESKLLCQPASPDSIPSSANQEDEVSMGLLAARWALQMAENLSRILACELLCASQALLIRREYLKETRAAEEIGCNAVVRPDAVRFSFLPRKGEFKLGKGTAQMLERAQSIAHLPLTKDAPLAEIVEALAESLGKE